MDFSPAAVDSDFSDDGYRSPSAAANDTTRLRLLSYNIQTGIATRRFSNYFTHSWKHLLPHGERMQNLNHIAGIIGDYDVVGLQELDAGSLRTGFINQAEYLAVRAGFPVWHDRTNRRIGRFARHSMGILSRYSARKVSRHDLPGRIPGRGVMVMRFGHGEASLTIAMMHMALSQSARQKQFEFIGELVRDHPNVILMGDFNCEPGSAEMQWLSRNTSLTLPTEELYTFPSWKPLKHLDHILVTPSIEIEDMSVLNYPLSDHLPISMTVRLPAGVRL